MSKNSISTLPRRRLGRTELMIPVVPFGTQGFGNHFGFVEDEKAVELIKHAISLGANHFDTARCYGDSQRKLGLAMKEGAREEVIITARVSTILLKSGVVTAQVVRIIRRNGLLLMWRINWNIWGLTTSMA